MNMDRTRRSLSLIFLVVVSIGTRDSFADNGELALARPVKRITIDGDFTDWPSSLPWYSIERVEFGEPPEGASDFDASFRVGYDQNALYVAVKVRDNSTVVDGTNRWNTQDGCSIYLDLEHSGEDKGSIQYSFCGDGSPLFESASPKVVTSSCQRSGTTHRYEWRFDIKQISTQVELKPGRVVGLDINLCDKDEDESFSWVSWGTGTQKAFSSTRLGDILLISVDDVLGKVRGRLVGETGAAPIRRQAVKLHRQTQTSAVTVMSNSSGDFDVVLPAGEYRAFTTSTSRIKRFQLKAGGESRVELRTTATTEQPTSVPLRTVVAAVKSTRAETLHSYSWAGGLRSGNVVGLAQAADGSLWIAGDVGLAHFDGQSMTAFEEQDGTRLTCQALAIDHSGIVWGGSPLGIFRYDGKSFTRFSRANGLPAGAVKQIISDKDGNLWILTSHGVSRYDGDSFTVIYQHESEAVLTSLAIETASRIWIGTSAGLIRRETGDDSGAPGSWRETHYVKVAGLPGEKAVNVRTLMIDSMGRLWIGTADGLAQYDGASFRSWTIKDGLANNSVFALAETEDGRLWVGTSTGVDEMWRGQFFHENKVASIHVMYVDREQNVWIGGESLFRFNSNRPWHPWHSHPLSITSKLKPRRLMFTRDGVLWVGTLHGLVQCKKNRIDYLADSTTKRYSTEDGLAGAAVTSLLEDSQGGVWIGTKTGVSHFDGKQFASLTVDNGLSTGLVTALAEDSTGRIWMGTSEGITIYDPSR
ncbi:MAG: hypothetical protein IH991_21290, partial [Planctomycetes bacterium]|nr:hypothetical protein [Planctomycetota bacterium]